MRAEAEERMRVEYTVAQNKVEQAQRAEQVLRAERVRKEAREKAAKEREEEKRAREMREKEEEVAKREGGVWIESGGKKAKGKKGFAVMPMGYAGKAGEKKENVGESPKKDSGEDKGGRAGTWGPKRILSRKEGIMQGQGVGQGQVGVGTKK